LTEFINGLSNVNLVGVHVNMECFGGIKTTPKILEEFSNIATNIEKIINRELEIVSGGHSVEFPMAIEGKMPSKINHLRIGTIMIQGRWLDEMMGFKYPFLYNETLILKAEIIEVEKKPSKPDAESNVDWSGTIPVFEDRGIRKRAIVGLGKVDFVDIQQIIPKENSIKILGASSDHTILDIEEYGKDLKVGNIIEFSLKYVAVVALFGSQDVKVIVT